jgi:hypothetical protein
VRARPDQGTNAAGAKKLLGKNFSHAAYRRALDEGYRALKNSSWPWKRKAAGLSKASEAYPDAVVALILGRSYTLYDPFVSKDLMSYARRGAWLPSPRIFSWNTCVDGMREGLNQLSWIPTVRGF